MEPMNDAVSAWQVAGAVAVFLLVYALIITEKVNRAVLALLGAVAMVGLGIVDFHAAYTQHIEWQTIFLLIGMMIIVGITNRTGVFQYIAVRAAQKVKGSPARLMFRLALITGLGSAFLDNVTTVLLMVPVTFAVTRILQINPLPILIAQVIACNIGGTATMIGDPPNMMIGTATPLTFADFLINLAPIVIVILLVALLVLTRLFAKDLAVNPDKAAELMAIDARQYIKDPVLLKKCIVVLGLTLAGFLVHHLLHTEAAVIAVSGAAVLMLIGLKEKDMDEVFHSIEWVTIFFFAGLFVLVGGLAESGVISFLASRLLEITSGDLLFTSMLVLWLSGVASATIDNIPFVAAMIPLVQDLGLQMGFAESGELNPVWWSLALGACLGGNGTLIGASANLVVASLAMREGHELSYMRFLRIGAPITVLALVLSSIYIWLVYF